MEGVAVRYHVTAQVDGRRFEDVTVDVGFADLPAFKPEVVRGPDLLNFASIPPAEVPTLPLEQHVAEKVHAYTRIYVGGQTSTRVKDLVDLAAIAGLFPFEAERLRMALHGTFGVRDTHALPPMLLPPPNQWSTAYQRMAVEVGLDPVLSVGYEQVRTFLGPILSGTVPNDARWDPARQCW